MLILGNDTATIQRRRKRKGEGRKLKKKRIQELRSE
jgi:hypothetical protein